ncbi:MAG: hypothetical protein AB7D57_08590, partial [Desulfovibrionaceae bacterium]
ERPDVLTVSIHGHPSFAYPYFSGFAEERGAGAGLGYNLNLPQAEALDGEGYRKALAKAVARIRRFKPMFLVVSLGLDPAKGDPTGSWSLTPEDFEQNGRIIGGLAGELGSPVLVVQEGGYKTQQLGVNARRFFTGLRAAAWGGADRPGPGHGNGHGNGQGGQGNGNGRGAPNGPGAGGAGEPG